MDDVSVTLEVCERVSMFVTTLSGDEGRLPFCSAGVWWPIIEGELPFRREEVDDCSSVRFSITFMWMDRPLWCCSLSDAVVIQADIEEGSPLYPPWETGNS